MVLLRGGAEQYDGELIHGDGVQGRSGDKLDLGNGLWVHDSVELSSGEGN